MSDDVIAFVRQLYQTTEFIPLHEPRFWGNEKAYVSDTIDSTFVSSVGAYVERFEKEFAEFTGADFAVATVNGTAALHICLLLAGVKSDDEVITQPLTFVATSNAISYCNAHPVYIDVDRETLGLSPDALRDWLTGNAKLDGERCVNRQTGRTISACVPMHTFGHPAQTEQLNAVCAEWKITVIEDTAEAVGSYIGSRHVSSSAKFAAYSFNGNKIMTTGGGGMITTCDAEIAAHAKHLTTTAKVAHPWRFDHDQVGYNYRLPNLNAALGVAQLEQVPGFLEEKRKVADQYRAFFKDRAETFVDEPSLARSNFWLNAILLDSKEERDQFLKATNDAGVMTRPVWTLNSQLPTFKESQCGPLDVAEYLADRLVNLPSSVPEQK